MSHEIHHAVSELAPAGSPDPVGLEQARAAFERRRSGADRAGSVAIDVGSVPRGRRRSWRPRHVVAVGVVGLLVGVGGAVGVFLADRPGDDGATAPVGGATPSAHSIPLGLPETCGQYFSASGAEPVPVEQWDGLLDHAVTRPDVPITAPPTLEAVPIDCADGLATAFYVDRENQRAIAVRHGEPIPSGADPETGIGPSGATPVDLRGTTAGEIAAPAGPRSVWWVEDGDQWYARGNGMTQEELVSVLESLELDSGTVSGTPPGYERVDLPKVEPGTTQYQWMLWQGRVQDGWLSSGGPYVRVAWPDLVPTEFAYLQGNAEVVEFDGGQATYSEDTTGVNANIFSWSRDGVQYSISDSDADLATMKQIARSMEPVDAQDPRLRLDEWNYD